MRLYPGDGKTYAEIKEELAAENCHANLNEFLEQCRLMIRRPHGCSDPYQADVYVLVHTKQVEGDRILVFIRSDGDETGGFQYMAEDDDTLDGMHYLSVS